MDTKKNLKKESFDILSFETLESNGDALKGGFSTSYGIDGLSGSGPALSLNFAKGCGCTNTCNMTVGCACTVTQPEQ